MYLSFLTLEFRLLTTITREACWAIMLGRLRMSIDECEAVYVELAQKIFIPNRSEANFIGRGLDFVNARGKFSSEVLEAGIKNIVKSKGFLEDELFFDQVDDDCKV
jgi:hypothetical protein